MKPDMLLYMLNPEIRKHHYEMEKKKKILLLLFTLSSSRYDISHMNSSTNLFFCFFVFLDSMYMMPIKNM